jgi:cellulose biosynthesis protein BcsE
VYGVSQPVCWQRKSQILDTDTESTSRSLGIADIPSYGSEMTVGSVYLCLSAGKKHLSALVSSICKRNDSPDFIGLCTPDELFRGLNNDASQLLDQCLQEQCKRVHFWHDPEEITSGSVGSLLRDLKKFAPTEPRLYIIVAKATSFPSKQQKKLNKVLGKWQAWARQYQHTVLFLCHGSEKTIETAALHANNLLSGLSSAYALDTNHYRYFIHHWNSDAKVIADQEYLLTTSSAATLKAIDIPREHIADSGVAANNSSAQSEIVTTTNVASEISSELDIGIVVASNNLIMNSFDELHSATVIFACSSPTEVVELATMTYQLRSRYRQNIKILIRENVQCLRYADEQFLLKAGATQIIPYVITSTRLVSHIDAIRNINVVRQLPPTLYGLLESRQTSNYRGYADSFVFASSVTKTMDSQRYSGVEHILVRFEPLRGISLEQSLNLCSIKRDGDLITVCRGFIYIFLHACRLNDVGVALRNSLVLPVQDAFGSQSVIHDPDDIAAELELIDLSTDGIPMDIGQKLLASNPEKIQTNKTKDLIAVPLATPYVIN